MAVSKSLAVNGKVVTISIDDPEMPLLYALRDNLEFTVRASAAGSVNVAPGRSMLMGGCRALLHIVW